MESARTSERVSDVSDAATREELRGTELAIAAIRREVKPPSDWDKETCYECGVELPVQRIKANRFLCVGCKTLEEKRKKGYWHEDAI